MKQKDINHAKELSKEFVDGKNDLHFFEEIYKRAKSENITIPWARMSPNPNVTEWLDKRNFGENLKALKVGCGLGDDAEELQNRGFEVTAFDISTTAIEHCFERFKDTKVEYLIGDILNPKEDWQNSFDFILEVYTLQSMPKDMRVKAIANIAKLLNESGELLVIAMAREEDEEVPELPPYPLTLNEIKLFEKYGLKIKEVEDFIDSSTPLNRRHFRVWFKK